MARLEFILGRAGTGKTEACLRAMCDAMEREPLGKMLLLVVPEHMTYQAERELAARTRSGGTMRGTVSGFRRLAWRAAEQSRLPRMTEIGKRLILKKIVKNRADELSVLARGAGQRGFTVSLAEMIEELKSYHGMPENLRAAAAVVDDGYLSKKLEDLSLLYEDFLRATENRFEDAEDRMAALADAVRQSPDFAGAEVWLDGFVFFNPQEREILRAFFRTAGAVHITLPMGRDVSAREPVAPSELFYRAAHTLQRLKRVAEEMGIPYTVRVLGTPRRFSPEAHGIAALERGLFDFPVRAEQGGDTARGVRVTEAATRRLEMEAAGADMLRLCREEGFRWRDIGVLLRDGENYGELLEFTLKEYGIPFFTDRKRAGTHHPLAELIRSALETVTEGWTYDAVFRCVKTGLLPLENDEADVLENYVLEFGIRGESGWKKDWPYLRRRAHGAEEAESFLQSVNQTRRKVAEPFLALSDALQAESVQDKTRALYDFLETLHVPETLAHWTEEAETAGALEEAREHRMIWQAAMELLDQMVSVSRDEKISLSDYAELLTDGLDALELSLIPQKIDSVTIADFDQNSLNNVRALYILGANDGVMPKRPSSGGILSDADRALLAAKKDEARLELAKTAAEESCGENYLLYHGFTEAREYVWISYALADSEGKGVGRSSVVTRLLKLLPGTGIQSIPLEGMRKEQEEEMLFSAGKRALSRLVPILREYVACPGAGRRGAWGEVYNWALDHARDRLSVICRGLFAGTTEGRLPPLLAKRLFVRDRRLSGSVTRFERYYQCPFHHFAYSGLRLEERAEYSFRPIDMGTLLHTMMRGFGEVLRQEGRPWPSVSAEERGAFVRDAMRDAALDMKTAILGSTAQYQYLAARIGRTAESSIARLSDWAGDSAFAPRYFELSFGEGTSMGALMSWPMPESDVRLDITGQIDRIDCGEIEDESGERRPYFLILDYKTGEADLSLLDVYYGLRLQLLTYLEAAKRFFDKRGNGGARPAGVLYCLLKNPALSENGNLDAAQAEKKWLEKLRMKGWLLSDAKVIQKVDGTSRHIRVKMTKDGAIDGKYKGNVKTASELETLAAYTMRKLREAGDKVLSGDVAIRPFHVKNRSACAFCPYGDVCGFDSKLGGFAYRELDDTISFLREMEQKGGDGHGNGQ
ncbi:MAG: PD-(D/E)XK nuclease family protein [Schwartzia sp.]|nr:PD-(D/E)XK nuclease family protein [Schwartzia sp. (in: firmicutes)]